MITSLQDDFYVTNIFDRVDVTANISQQFKVSAPVMTSDNRDTQKQVRAAESPPKSMALTRCLPHLV